ncbi:hypothetical protein HK098_005999 [Nowakowskiella sp. JEL0407]|nr:hypothetical protein HK098_005999 [Nowakowskiella sp. JEL0407]
MLAVSTVTSLFLSVSSVLKYTNIIDIRPILGCSQTTPPEQCWITILSSTTPLGAFTFDIFWSHIVAFVGFAWTLISIVFEWKKPEGKFAYIKMNLVFAMPVKFLIMWAVPLLTPFPIRHPLVLMQSLDQNNWPIWLGVSAGWAFVLYIVLFALRVRLQRIAHKEVLFGPSNSSLVDSRGFIFDEDYAESSTRDETFVFPSKADQSEEYTTTLRTYSSGDTKNDEIVVDLEPTGLNSQQILFDEDSESLEKCPLLLTEFKVLCILAKFNVPGHEVMQSGQGIKYCNNTPHTNVSSEKDLFLGEDLEPTLLVLDQIERIEEPILIVLDSEGLEECVFLQREPRMAVLGRKLMFRISRGCIRLKRTMKMLSALQR